MQLFLTGTNILHSKMVRRSSFDDPINFCDSFVDHNFKMTETKEKLTKPLSEAAEKVSKKVQEGSEKVKQVHEEAKEKAAEEKTEKQKEGIKSKASELYEQTKEYLTPTGK
eukprot:gene1197-10711_t